MFWPNKLNLLFMTFMTCLEFFGDISEAKVSISLLDFESFENILLRLIVIQNPYLLYY